MSATLPTVNTPLDHTRLAADLSLDRRVLLALIGAAEIAGRRRLSERDGPWSNGTLEWMISRSEKHRGSFGTEERGRLPSAMQVLVLRRSKHVQGCLTVDASQ